MVEILGAALIPYLAGLGDKAFGGATPVVIGAIGVIIALSTAAGTLYKFHENWRIGFSNAPFPPPGTPNTTFDACGWSSKVAENC